MPLIALNNKIMRVVEWIVVLSLVILTLLISLQILNRYVMKVPMPWTEELARYMFVYLTMFGSAKAVRDKSHIFVDILEVVVKGLPAKISSLVADIISLIFFIILFVVSIPWTMKNFGVLCESMPIDIGFFYLCVPVSALIMVSFGIENLWRRSLARASDEGVDQLCP